MAEYDIRPATPEDIPHLAAVEQAAASLFPPGSIPDSIRSDSVPIPMLEAACDAGRLWVAAQGGIIAGFAIWLVADGCAVLGEMDVHPAHGRKGLGRGLVAAVAGKARDEGHDALFLTTFNHVPWNRPFYERLGFQTLREAEAPSVIRQSLAEERARGMRHRVAMRLALGPEHRA